MLSTYRNIKQKTPTWLSSLFSEDAFILYSHFPSVTLALNIEGIFSKRLALKQNCKENSYIMFMSRGTQGIFA